MHFGMSLALQLDLTARFLMVNLRQIKPQNLTVFIYKTREQYRKSWDPLNGKGFLSAAVSIIQRAGIVDKAASRATQRQWLPSPLSPKVLE